MDASGHFQPFMKSYRSLLRGFVGPALLLLAFGRLTALLHGAGARLLESGPIQVTADGGWVWVANRDNDSVSRLDTTNEIVTEFVLPDPGTPDSPRGLSVKEAGSEIWVACHDSDRIYVLGADGAMV